MKTCRIIETTIYRVDEDVTGMSTEEILEAWSSGELAESYEDGGDTQVEGTTTPFGYDPLWIEAINGVLDDREIPHIRVRDLNDEIWERFIGPMIDAIEESELENDGGISRYTPAAEQGGQS